jgi:hypothetical protein
MKQNIILSNQNYNTSSQPSENKIPFFFNPIIQPKLIINQPNDYYEREADTMADKVMRMEQPDLQLKQLPITGIQRKCAHCQEEEKMQRKEIDGKATTAGNSLESYVGSLSSGGQPLPNEVRNFYEPRFGYDFSNVKIHTDIVATKSAQSINALAYTSGNNIVFNSGQYAPNTTTGKRLLGHELTHVVQQKDNSPQIQRQPFFLSPMQSVDISKLGDNDLMKRQYAIKVLLDTTTSCSPQTAAAIFELNQIEAELNSRSGKTFSSDAIERLKKYHEANAAKDKAVLKHDSCIVALNKGVSTLQGRTAKELKTTPATIEKTMDGMDSVGLISSKIEINFFDKQGRPTTGSTFPYKLQNSVWDTALTMATGDTGWIVFGLSLMDGNHSITLTLDNNNPVAPKIYWSDQWGSKGGWKLYDKAGLDKEVTDLIQEWWNTQAEGKKFNTVVRLWRLKPYK